MKVAFIGLGSIAKKHIHALNIINKDISLYAVRHREKASKQNGVINVVFSDLKNLDLDAIIISNPSVFHAQNILELVELDTPIMVEKPICVSMDQLKQLDEISRHSAPLIYTACNLRFHPLITFLKAYLQREKPKIFEVSAYCGSYLPSWRENADYENTYSAKANMGGGVHLDLIHEFDYLSFLFGKPNKVEKFYAKRSDLKIDSIDYAHYRIDFENFTATNTLNYFRRDSKRTLEIVTENDTILLDFINGNIKLLMEDKTLFEVDKNAMFLSYVNQMNYFLSLFENKQEPMNTLDESIDIIRHIL